MPAGARSRSRRRPSRSSDETGSSNQRHARVGESVAPMRSACLRAYAPLASTNSSQCRADRLARRATRSQIARADRGRSSSSRARCLRSAQPPQLLVQARLRVRGEAAAAVDRHRLRAPCRAAAPAARPSSFAFRSQSAMSTAEIAIGAMPGRPMVANRAAPCARRPAAVECATTPVTRGRDACRDQRRAVALSRSCSRARVSRPPARSTSTSVVCSTSACRRTPAASRSESCRRRREPPRSPALPIAVFAPSRRSLATAVLMVSPIMRFASGSPFITEPHTPWPP